MTGGRAGGGRRGIGRQEREGEMQSERWTRGAGNGIGLSSHKNQYRLGVGIGNWVEDEYSAVDGEGGAQDVFYSKGARMNHTSTNRAMINEEGKYGIANPGIESYIRPRVACESQIVFAHDVEWGLTDQKRQFVTMSETAYSKPSKDKTRIEKNLWHGSKKNDARVPMTKDESFALRAAKDAKAKADAEEMSFVQNANTTSEVRAGDIATAVASLSRAEAQSGVSKVGRKVTNWNKPSVFF